jgi:HemY protein
MNLFRNLLFWIALILLGALVAQLLVQDPGYVLVRYGGNDYSTTLVGAVLGALIVLFVLWLVWKLLTLPFVALRRHRKKQARARLTEGLLAAEQGHWARAEKSLSQAAENDEAATVAQLVASRVARTRGDMARARRIPPSTRSPSPNLPAPKAAMPMRSRRSTCPPRNRCRRVACCCARKRSLRWAVRARPTVCSARCASNRSSHPNA